MQLSDRVRLGTCPAAARCLQGSVNGFVDLLTSNTVQNQGLIGAVIVCTQLRKSTVLLGV